LLLPVVDCNLVIRQRLWRYCTMAYFILFYYC